MMKNNATLASYFQGSDKIIIVIKPYLTYKTPAILVLMNMNF